MGVPTASSTGRRKSSVPTKRFWAEFTKEFPEAISWIQKLGNGLLVQSAPECSKIVCIPHNLAVTKLLAFLSVRGVVVKSLLDSELMPLVSQGGKAMLCLNFLEPKHKSLSCDRVYSSPFGLSYFDHKKFGSDIFPRSVLGNVGDILFLGVLHLLADVNIFPTMPDFLFRCGDAIDLNNNLAVRLVLPAMPSEGKGSILLTTVSKSISNDRQPIYLRNIVAVPIMPPALITN